MSYVMKLMARVALVAVLIVTTIPLVQSPSAPAVDLAQAAAQARSFKVSPGQAAKLTYDGATLDIGAGAVASDMTVTIAPLAEVDLPTLDQGMSNTTMGPRRGYRLLPHNTHFKKQITITLPYDPTLIPAGLSEQDIKTYFFDDQLGSWQELDRVSVDPKKLTITSNTDHFTDFISATVTVPEHSQPLSFNPNTIKNIKAADPGAGITLIEPPTVNNSGDARLAYPLDLPPGREGMQPQLSFGYNSSGGNGWVGLGWELSTSTVTIDTRWGVPRYDPNLETETYLIDGQQLTPVAHRGPLVPRADEREFHSRIESQFRKIIRHGDSPTTYWWEVIDKVGTHYFYGNPPQPDPGGTAPTFVLAAPGTPANVFTWLLREVRDTNGNTIRYFYHREEGGAGGGEPWRQVYLQRIRYTGSGVNDGPYEVVFNREAGRPDVIVDGRAGFKTVLADRLASIDVRLVTEPSPLIRRYRLEYETGQFSKSRLVRITQYGEDGTTEFNHHTFAYFDEVAADPAQPTKLDGFRNTPGFGGATTVDGEGILFDQESTAFGGSAGSSNQGHFYGGISPSGYSKENSAGTKVGLGVSNSTNLLTLIDLNGDGLPDQVFREGGDVYFRANTGGPLAAPNFDPQAKKVEGLAELGGESSTTFTIGAELYKPGGSAFTDTSFTRTRGDSYLTDVNGDGLPDLVVKGAVRFNSLVNGVPTFGPNSPTPLTPGANSDTSGMVQNPEAGRAEMEAEYHLVDPLRRWVAPYSGTIQVTGDVRLLSAPPASYTTADGVRASIQHNSGLNYNAELWAVTISNPNDTAGYPITTPNQPAVPLSVSVSAGDRLYFRVNSLNDGAFDAVEFDPTVTYTQVSAPPAGGLSGAVDENGMPQFVYNAANDFAYGGRALPLTVPFTGKATLTGTLDKPAATSDDVAIEILIDGAALVPPPNPPLKWNWDATGTFPFTVHLGLAENQQVTVRIQADSRIDLSKVRLVPGTSCQVPGKGPSPVCLTFTEIDGQPAPTDPASGQHLLVFTPPVTAQIYPRDGSPIPYSPFTVQLEEGGAGVGTCADGIDNNGGGLIDLADPTCNTKARVRWTAFPDLFYDDTNLVPEDTTSLDYNMTLSVKRASERLAKLWVAVRDAAILDSQPQPSGVLSAHFDVSSGDKLYVVLDAAATDDSTLAFNESAMVAPELVLANPVGSEDGGDPGSCTDGADNGGDGATDVDDPECQLLLSNVTSDVHLGLATREAFGGGFRGWGFGQYNGQDTTGPIEEPRLRLPTDEKDDAADYFVPMVPFLDEGRWRAEDEEAWIAGGQMSASRLMVNYLDFPTGAGFGGARGVVRYGGGENLAAGGGLGFSVLSFGAGVTEGDTWSDIDFLDFNGDRYPDVVGNGQVQTTLPNGALDDERIPVGGFGRVRESDSDSYNANLGATLSRQVGDARGRLQGITTEQAAYNLSASLGLTGNYGDYDAKWDLVDINGDDLPDYVRPPDAAKGETALVVRLNLGYRFAAEEQWANASALRFEQSLSAGLSTGVGATAPAYSYGGGFSHTLSTSAAEQDFVDVNGDGLVDLVVKDVEVVTAPKGILQSPATELSVRFNTGAGFTSQTYKYTGAMPRPLRENGTVSRNLGLHFTIPIPIPFTTAAIILNPGYNHGNSLGGFEVMLADFDGDGYPDHIYSDTNGNVDVNLNNHGRTNLLKTVHRPLGATIELDYARSGNTTDQPGNRWVLSRATVTDGFDGDGADQQVKAYRYAGGKYDRAEREFYGFRTVTEQHLDANAVYRQVTRKYLNDTYYSKGLLESEALEDGDGNKFTETVDSYQVVTLTGGVGNPTSFTDPLFPQRTRTDQYFFEGLNNSQPGKSTYVTYQYDTLGNVTQFFDAGDSGSQGHVFATVEYSQCPTSYIVGVPTRIVVTGTAGVMRERQATVDCATGNVTEVRQYLADGSYAQTNLDYFGNGNLKRVTEPENRHGVRAWVEYDYDATVQTHRTKAFDNLGYTSSATYNFKYGRGLSDTDVNGNRTSRTYDQFGRQETATGPYEQGGPKPTIKFEYHPDVVPPWAKTSHLDPYRDPTGADTIDTVLFIDGLKRTLQTKKDATIHTAPGVDATVGMVVSGRSIFDFVGRVAEQHYPNVEADGSAGTFNPIKDNVTPTRYEYDVLDRLLKTEHPDGTLTTNEYGFGADRAGTTQFQVTLTDANGIKKQSYRDVRQQVTGRKDYHTPVGGTTQVLWTSYVYDPLKQLVEVTDTGGNVTRLAYDNLGRRTMIDNPDTGRTETVYDLASNTIATITANLRAQGKQVSYDYDAINRLTAITYPNFPGNNVTYTYGPAGATDNSAGRITHVKDQSGAEERFYGKLGELTKEVKTIVGFTGAPPDTYTTQYVYDTFGRLQSLTYPDGEVLTYKYDAGGMIRQATGKKGPNSYTYIGRLEYDKFDQRAFLEAGNGVRTQYAYDPANRRLANLRAGRAGAGPFQNLLYQYDDVGNVLGLANDVPVPSASQSGGPTNQVFVYDDLYRLTGATGAFQYAPGKTNQYSLSQAYDNIHNIISKQQTNDILQPPATRVEQHKTTYSFTYDYGAVQPHAPTHVDNRTFTYDANGNQTGWTNDLNGTLRKIVWDDENRIQSVFDNGHEKAYTYDDAGERVMKRGPQGQTAYVNQYFTVRNGQIGTKHVFAGTTRMVSKLLKKDPSVVEKDQYFYHPDHLGSSNYVTDAAGQLYEHLEYFPFGETWVQQASNTQRTPYLFTSKELDEETGLYYYGARYQDPRLSQFISADPLLTSELQKVLERPDLLGAYNYATNNPLMYVDPDGRQPYKIYPSEVEAARQASADAKVQADKHGGSVEFGGTIFRDPNSKGYYYIPAQMGAKRGVPTPGQVDPKQAPPKDNGFKGDGVAVAYYHTHPHKEGFSEPEDTDYLRREGKTGYVITPSGKLLVFRQELVPLKGRKVGRDPEKVLIWKESEVPPAAGQAQKPPPPAKAPQKVKAVSD